MKNRLIGVGLVLLSLTVFSLFFKLTYLHAEPSADVQKQAGPSTVAAIDPEADELLRAMSATLEAAKTFSVKTHVNFDDVLKSGQKIQYGGDIEIKLKRPNKIVGYFDGDLVERSVWLDNGTLTILNMDKDFYGELKVPPTIDETVDFMLDNYDFTLPLADIVYSSPYKSVSADIQTGVVVGVGRVEGKDCVHLAFTQEFIDWQIWIDESNRHLPCKLVINYKTQEGEPQYSAEFSDWKLDQKMSDKEFKPNIPKEALKIEFIKMDSAGESENDKK